MAENSRPLELTMSPERVEKSTEKDIANFHGVLETLAEIQKKLNKEYSNNMETLESLRKIAEIKRKPEADHKVVKNKNEEKSIKVKKDKKKF